VLCCSVLLYTVLYRAVPCSYFQIIFYPCVRCRFPLPQPVALWIAHVACFAGNITHAPDSTVTTQYSAVQYSTVTVTQYNIAKCSAAQCSAVQCSAILQFYEKELLTSILLTLCMTRFFFSHCDRDRSTAALYSLLVLCRQVFLPPYMRQI
jgi:hypothetical protein